MSERRDAAIIVAALAHFFPILGNLEQQLQIIARVVTAFLQSSNDRLDRGVRVAERKRRARGVANGRARFCRFDDIHGGHAANIVRMHVHRQANFGVERLHQALGAIRSKQARHVFDGDGVGTQVLQFLGILQKAIERMHGRYGVRNSALEPAAARLNSLGVVDDVANVVQSVEHAEHLNAVFFRACDETVHDVLGIMLVTYQVLAARQHGQIGVGHMRLDGTQTLPRVLVKKTQTRVERRTAPRLNGPIPYFVHLRQDGQHVAKRHTGSPQALLAVANGGIHQLQTRHASPLTFPIRPRTCTAA